MSDSSDRRLVRFEQTNLYPCPRMLVSVGLCSGFNSKPLSSLMVCSDALSRFKHTSYYDSTKLYWVWQAVSR